MSLFSQSKQPDPGKVPAKKRHELTMVCPECQHEQPESKFAVSTYCRSCGSHYKIDHGKPVHQVKNPSNPFATLSPENSKKQLQKTSESGDLAASEATRKSQAAPPVAKQLPSQHSPSPSTQAPVRRTAPPNSELGKKTATATGFFKKKIPPRVVKCFDCDREHQAPAEASSTNCPACGAYISLRDFDIRENWNRRIQTRGNVTIQKKATVSGVTIRCHNINVQGVLKGGVNCSGDLVLGNHSRIMGDVRAKRLIIEKRAHVAFANTVHCEDVIIDGHVTGHLVCSGKLHLKKKAVLNGNIEVGTMIIDNGARHNGKVSIQPPPPGLKNPEV